MHWPQLLVAFRVTELLAKVVARDDELKQRRSKGLPLHAVLAENREQLQAHANIDESAHVDAAVLAVAKLDGLLPAHREQFLPVVALFSNPLQQCLLQLPLGGWPAQQALHQLGKNLRAAACIFDEKHRAAVVQRGTNLLEAACAALDADANGVDAFFLQRALELASQPELAAKVVLLVAVCARIRLLLDVDHQEVRVIRVDRNASARRVALAFCVDHVLDGLL